MIHMPWILKFKLIYKFEQFHTCNVDQCLP